MPAVRLMTRIALVVDNPYRDLPGLVLLAIRLCQQEATCFLVPMYWAGREFWTLAPDFVLYHYLRVNNEDEAQQLLDAGIRVGCLDTEGGVLTDLDTYAQWLPKSPATRHRISCYCSWGPTLAEHARQQNWFGDAEVVVTGAPRFDFYAPCWRPAALRASSHAAGYSRPLVLINGSFSVCNPQFQTPQREAEMLVEHFGYDPEYVKDWQEGDRRALLGMVELANRLAARFPEVTFVYRPHPFERLQTYHGLLDKRENLHLVREGTVDGWILRASAVIQSGCSTAIEAGLAGIPALSAAWLPKTAATTVPAVESVSIQCRTEDELTDTLAGILASRFDVPAPIGSCLNEVIDNWFYRIDGRAHDRVAKCVMANVPADSGRRRLRNCRRLAHGLDRRPTSWRQRVRAGVVSALGLSVHWSFRQWANVTRDFSSWYASEKRFTARQVQGLVDAIEPQAQEVFPQPYRKVRVRAAQDRGNYHFGYLEGQSVTIFPA